MLKMLRVVAHSLSALPALWLACVLLTGDETQLGADPIKEIQHFLGFTAITILLIVFVLGIIFNLLKQFQLQILRRALGLWGWFYAILHIASYFLLELGGDLSLFLQELVSRQYLIIGLGSFLILTLMSVSSLPAVKNVMGKSWRYVHKLGYFALLFGAIHYYWSVKNITLASIVYLSLTAIIVIWELYFSFIHKKPRAM
ncbi:protein-methionine-sulfoxide reductase heme-binding subunit MsrQ [Pasteurella dagmatis]|uniref:Protein-methionine-sulfoxide reductase heme-binding subunit MsrQ n=1 Tax=Pasteurella dagmatis ATCC 43325 TaxID=667128 RepID=C9PR13_9PAST|nr:protein-methionine-sulfoxide reductase heme-binding subunit MsrQ [Pasteurella dagmatis]EEX49914.1 ferric reductase like transmembrane component [Pasteurella dagmatis ATCC 43325]SNV60444.1 sulfoxide reductase heme-binding subunit YedZ [Pasteurella dagmatis]